MTQEHIRRARADAEILKGELAFAAEDDRFPEEHRLRQMNEIKAARTDQIANELRAAFESAERGVQRAQQTVDKAWVKSALPDNTARYETQRKRWLSELSQDNPGASGPQLAARLRERILSGGNADDRRAFVSAVTELLPDWLRDEGARRHIIELRQQLVEDARTEPVVTAEKALEAAKAELAGVWTATRSISREIDRDGHRAAISGGTPSPLERAVIGTPDALDGVLVPMDAD